MPRILVAPLFLSAVLAVGCVETASRRALPAETATEAPAVAVAPLAPDSVGQIPRLTRAGEIYLAGQPAADDFLSLKEVGVTTVINLRHADEMNGFDEAAAAEATGLRYEALPWSGPDELTDAIFDRTRELLQGSDGGALLHCASANRVGAVWLPFRVLDQGVDLEQAVAEARQVGLRTPEYEELARDYIARNRLP